MSATEGRRCIKCGRDIGPDATICDACNRAGMATPSATQYHGTVVVAIVLAVAGLALAASISLRGVGPYVAEVRGVTPADIGQTITYAVTNQGTRPGRAKCQLVALDADGRRMGTRNTLTPQIAGGESVEQEETISGLDADPSSVTVTCS